MLSEDEIESKYLSHTQTPDSRLKHRIIRQLFIELTSALNVEIPDGRPKSVMITHLEEAAMWANKAVSEMNPVVRG